MRLVMPSPFPGMDPYLEHPAIFPGFHDRFIAYFSEAIQAALPAPYFADIGDRLWVEISDRFIGPDVNILQSEDEPRDAPAETGGGLAIAVEAATRPLVIHVPHDEHREPFVQIFSQVGGERLVTTVEVLSLANKTPGAHGHDLYRRKQQEIIYGQVHLVEIDLLRGGQHATAVPLERLRKKAGKYDYHICTHRFDNLEDFFVYPVLLTEALPAISVPLLPGDGDVTINLQSIFYRCYETGPYARRIRYGESVIDPPLSAELSTWTAEILKSKRA
ncbi:MAG: DUF4058 family protein [Pirellulaceae bacterium]